jgi:hypothetical protein
MKTTRQETGSRGWNSQGIQTNYPITRQKIGRFGGWNSRNDVLKLFFGMIGVHWMGVGWIKKKRLFLAIEQG